LGLAGENWYVNVASVGLGVEVTLALIHRSAWKGNSPNLFYIRALEDNAAILSP
jgi:hypothetical protein